MQIMTDDRRTSAEKEWGRGWTVPKGEQGAQADM